MATSSYVASLLGGVEQGLKRALTFAFEYVLRNLRFGRADDQSASENFQGYFYSATTHATANTEFSVAHSLGQTPYLVIPVLPLDAVGAKIVPLTVTRAADDVRIYLSSSVESAPITLYVEV